MPFPIAGGNISKMAYDNANEAINKSNEAANKAEEAKGTAETVRDEFDRVVAEAGENNPEVVQARGEYVNLNARLDDTTAQLAQTVTDLSKTVTLINPTMTTNEIQTLLNNGGLIKFIKGVYELEFQTINPYPKVLHWDIDTPIANCLDIQSDSDIIIEKGATFNCPTTDKQWFALMNVWGKNNVSIINGDIIGERNTHTGTGGEWGAGLWIEDSTNVYLENINSNDNWGDGFTVGGTSKNITMINCHADNNRRQGLSITGVDGFYAENSTFDNTNGTNPQCGVDIETEWKPVKNVKFKRCTASGNINDGFRVDHNKETLTGVDIVFEDCRTKGNKRGFANYNFKNEQGRIEFVRCIAEEEDAQGFYELNCSSESIETVYRNCIALNCNASGWVSYVDGGYGSAFEILGNSQSALSTIGNCIFENCKAIDNRETPSLMNGFVMNANSKKVVMVKFIEVETQGKQTGGYNRFFYGSNGFENIAIKDIEQPRINLSSGTILSLHYLNHEFTNKGATGWVGVDLPIAKKGYLYSFRTESTQNFGIVPNGTALILGIMLDNTVTGIVSNAKGDFITLRGRDDGNWEIVDIFGGWKTFV